MDGDDTQMYPAARVLDGIGENWPGPWTARSRSLLLVQRLARLVQENARIVLQPHGLGFTEFEVLCALRAAPPPHRLLPTALYDAVLVSSGGLTKILKSLEAAGLITRPPSDGDGRTHPVELTRKGALLSEAAMTEIVAVDAARLKSSGMAQADYEVLEDRLSGMVAAMENPGR